jgi:hypothetical protein
MTKSFPYLAMDSAGKRSILCDYPIKMFSNIIKKEKTMPRIMTMDETLCHAKKVVDRMLAKDSSMDDESIAALKDFLQSKLRPEDHKAACALMDGASNGEPDVEAEDDVEQGLPRAAIDAKIGFDQRYPGLAHIKINNSGIAIPKRAANYSDAAAKSFADRYPGLAKIRQA